jgi:uncharacterized protein (TIGR02996 family)
VTATLTTGDALLQAILDPANFADDFLRLQYADVLEEEGEAERAEFIRVQVKLAAWPCECDSEERVYHEECRCKERLALHRRERESSLRCREWSGLPLLNVPWFVDYHGPTLSGLPPRALFRRGFVAAASCATADWLRHGPAVVRAQPLERVRLMDRQPTRYDGQYLTSPPGPYWRWFPATLPGERYPWPAEHRSEIPRALWAAYAALCRAEGRRWEHLTEEAAWDALSWACLSWARSQEPVA